MNLGYDTLSSLNSRLIYVSLTGFGSTGPSSTQPGYDLMLSARGGLMGITGHTHQPAKVGVAITDISTGLYAASSILAALWERDAKCQPDGSKGSNKGQKIELSLLGVQVACLANVGQNYHVDHNKKGTRWGTAHEVGREPNNAKI